MSTLQLSSPSYVVSNPKTFEISSLQEGQALVCLNSFDYGMILFRKGKDVVALSNLFKQFFEQSQSIHLDFSKPSQRAVSIKNPSEYYKGMQQIFPYYFEKNYGYKWAVFTFNDS